MRKWLIIAVAVCGCTTQVPGPVGASGADNSVRQSVNPMRMAPRRQFTEKQIDALRSFAFSESPQLWQTVQQIKAESASRKAALKKLCKEMEDFGRDPNKDPDVAALRSAQVELEGSLDAIYLKLEEAYIAYKKMQATPGRKEYADMMRSALEDGILEADRTAARFKDMSRNK